MTFADARESDSTVKQLCLEGEDDKIIIAALAREKQELSIREQRLTMRFRALFHNCGSSACSAREDALKAKAQGDTDEETAKNREASAYDTVAGWLNHAIRDS